MPLGMRQEHIPSGYTRDMPTWLVAISELGENQGDDGIETTILLLNATSCPPLPPSAARSQNIGQRIEAESPKVAMSQTAILEFVS